MDEWDSTPLTRTEIGSVLACIKRWKNLRNCLLLPQDSFFLLCCDAYDKNANFDIDIFNDICLTLNPILFEGHGFISKSLIRDDSIFVIDPDSYRHLPLGEALVVIGAAKPEYN